MLYNGFDVQNTSFVGICLQTYYTTKGGLYVIFYLKSCKLVYMITVGKNTRCILENLTLEQIKSMVPEEWIMRILEEGGVTTDFRSVWLLVYWGRLTMGGMILTPMTDHHMMHLPPCLNNLSILD